MSLDWQKCVICQDATDEVLKGPLKSNVTEDNEEAYRTFLENVIGFREANALPADLKFTGNEVDVECLRVHNASWHKSCHLKFSSSKLRKVQERVNRKRRVDTIKEQEVPTSRKRKYGSHEANRCIFCEGGAEGDKLHCFATMETDTSVRRMALQLEDFELLGRISGGDLVAIDARYHLKCLITLRNRHRSLCKQQAQHENEPATAETDEAKAFEELVQYINGCLENGTLWFKLSDLFTLYVRNLEDHGIIKTVNKTRLKNLLLDHFADDAQEQTDGKHTLLVFQKGMNNHLKDALQRNALDDAQILAKAANIIRNDIFAHQGFNFSGCFPLDCQSKLLPSTLKSLISMILTGHGVKPQHQDDKPESQACLTVCQMILFNTKKIACSSKTGHLRHSIAREPPLPLYVGLNIHSTTRSKTPIDKMYQMGISVSYDRVIEIEDWLAKSLSERFKEDGCVGPV